MHRKWQPTETVEYVLTLVSQSPWAYETINRWNPESIDPNRSFVVPNSPETNKNYIEETALVMSFITAQMDSADQVVDFVMHIDLHETTDTDVTTFGCVDVTM